MGSAGGHDEGIIVTGGVTTKGICTTKGRWPYLNIKSGVTLDEINPTLSDQLIGYY